MLRVNIPDNRLDQEIDALVTFSRVQRELLAGITAKSTAVQVGEAFAPEGEPLRCAA